VGGTILITNHLFGQLDAFVDMFSGVIVLCSTSLIGCVNWVSINMHNSYWLLIGKKSGDGESPQKFLNKHTEKSDSQFSGDGASGGI